MTRAEDVTAFKNIDDFSSYRYSHSNPMVFLKANLSEWKPKSRNLSRMHIKASNFRNANLEGVDFSDANLTLSRFHGANLRNADFRGADLEGADFSGADPHRCTLFKQSHVRRQIHPPGHTPGRMGWYDCSIPLWAARKPGAIPLLTRYTHKKMNDRSAQIADRLPVWMALSELFLDTRLIDHDLERIAHSLAESPYSIRELEEILSSEVSPILKNNLRSTAGEWAGFDGDWLCQHLLPRIDRNHGSDLSTP